MPSKPRTETQKARRRERDRPRRASRSSGDLTGQGRAAGRNPRVGGNNARVADGAAPASPEPAAEDLRPPLPEGYAPARRAVWRGRKRVDAGHDPCTDYARRVVRGDEVAGPLVRAACQRHLDDLARAMTRTGRHRKGAALYWSIAWYEHFRDFASRLRLWQAQFYAEPVVLHPMQEFIFGSLFGWRMRREGDAATKPETWRRRFRRAYLEVGKGNAKTPSMSIIGLYGLTADGEPGAEVYVGAAKVTQARICMEDANHISRVSGLQGMRYMGVQPHRPDYPRRVALDAQAPVARQRQERERHQAAHRPARRGARAPRRECWCR